MTSLYEIVYRKYDSDGALDPAEAASLFKAVQNRMKKKTKPVSTWEAAGRGSEDPTKDLTDIIKPFYTKELKDMY